MAVPQGLGTAKTIWQPWSSNRTLEGPIRVIELPNGTMTFADDTGPRRLRGTSFFSAARQRHEPSLKAAYYRQMDSVVDSGDHYIRVFCRLAADFTGKDDDPSHVWYGRAIEWDYSIEETCGVLQDAKDRGFRVQLTSGTQFNNWGPDYIAFIRDQANAIHSRGLDETVWCWQLWNEPFQTTPYGCDDRLIDIAREMRKIITDTLSPAPLVAIGDMGASESPTEALVTPDGRVIYGGMEWSRRESDMCDVHGDRYWPSALKHIDTLTYWAFRSGPNMKKLFGYALPFDQSEGGGSGQGVSIARLDDHSAKLAKSAMAGLCGQSYCEANGSGIWGGLRGSAPEIQMELGFTTIPNLLNEFLPDDVASWDHAPVNNGKPAIWWLGKGDQLATVTASDWDYQNTPAPLKDWAIIGPPYKDGFVQTGHGALPDHLGGLGALILGTRA